MTFRYYLAALGAAPFMAAVLARITTPTPAEPIKPKPVRTETIRIIPLEARTFAERWGKTPYEIPITEVPVKTIPVRVATRETKPEPVIQKPVQEHNVCTRHGMRKVHYGKRWRCRR